MSDDTLDPQNEIDRQRDLALIRAGLEAAAQLLANRRANMDDDFERESSENEMCETEVRALSPETILKEWKGGGK